jgi:1-acyl-sn-glycerol-3-phosphate acyltransferase
MADLVYPPVVVFMKLAFRALDLRISVAGSEHIPRAGGAVLASNHISNLDFIFCGAAAQPARRLVRFMAKREIFAHPVGGPLMRGMHHISVDRGAGTASYKAALEALKHGEVVGVFPEGTRSTSFTVAEFKTGSVRMAAAAGVPLIPMAVWGTHRLWAKGRRLTLTKRHVPITILVGEPMNPSRRDEQTEVARELRTRIIGLVEKAQTEYPDRPSGRADSWWQPAYLGGTAPAAETRVERED